MDSIDAITGGAVQGSNLAAVSLAAKPVSRPVEKSADSKSASSDRNASANDQKEAAASQNLAKVEADPRQLNIELDKPSGRVVFQSVDRNTGEVKNQVPSEELLKLAASLRGVVGVFVDSRV